jgi:hypothetical protein
MNLLILVTSQSKTSSIPQQFIFIHKISSFYSLVNLDAITKSFNVPTTDRWWKTLWHGRWWKTRDIVRCYDLTRTLENLAFNGVKTEKLKRIIKTMIPDM